MNVITCWNETNDSCLSHIYITHIRTHHAPTLSLSLSLFSLVPSLPTIPSIAVRTWKNERFEFHGQCDVVMTSVKDFAGPGMDLDIHLRTSMVRYWSYIKRAAIRIGNDVLEIEGLSDFTRSYWINYEHNGELPKMGGGLFPVSINDNNDRYTIDLDPVYKGQKIIIQTYKEFVSVKIMGATQQAFGNAAGITGNFSTGKTLARDGATEIHDFNELGMEWQVLPSDGKLFREMARPQFPELCYLPEDPQGARARRLAESSITEEAAEAACAGLKNDFDRKGCIYDVLATQDLGMAGLY